MTTVKLQHGDDVWYQYGEMSPELCIDLNSAAYQQLWDLHPENKHTLYFNGRAYLTPRWQQSYGRDYQYAGNVNKGLPISENLQKYLYWANQNFTDNTNNTDSNNPKFNQILINWYQDGKHFINWHSDDTRQLEPNSPIITISYGVTRKFKIKSKPNFQPQQNVDINVENNSYLIMGGQFQDYYLHSVPKSAKIKDSRVSITLRQFKD